MHDSGLAVTAVAATAAEHGQLLLLETIAQSYLGMATAMLTFIVRRGGALAKSVWPVVNAAALGLTAVHALVVDHALLEGHMSICIQAHEHQMHARDAGLLVVTIGSTAVGTATATSTATATATFFSIL